MERFLATIQRIENLTPIENSDHLAVARVLGWDVVVRKDEVKKGDLGIYIEIDSILPADKPEFEFMKPRNYRVKTIKLRGQISQGLFMPWSLINKYIGPWDYDPIQCGRNVTEHLGITKYEPPIAVQLAGKVKGYFPGFLPKTDEPRVQSIIDVLLYHKEKAYYVTEKLDGTSFTAFNNRGEFGICSRNMHLQLEDTTVYAQIAKEADLQSGIPEGFAIQGEIVGPGIQGNKLKLNKHKLFVYNLFDIEKQQYFSYDAFSSIMYDRGFECVPLLTRLTQLPSLEDLIKLATRRSTLDGSVWAEGIVIRAIKEENVPRVGRLSFKVINPEFLLHYGE